MALFLAICPRHSLQGNGVVDLEMGGHEKLAFLAKLAVIHVVEAVIVIVVNPVLSHGFLFNHWIGRDNRIGIGIGPGSGKSWLLRRQWLESSLHRILSKSLLRILHSHIVRLGSSLRRICESSLGTEGLLDCVSVGTLDKSVARILGLWGLRLDWHESCAG